VKLSVTNVRSPNFSLAVGVQTLAIAAEVDVFRVSNLRAIKDFGCFQIKLWPSVAHTGATTRDCPYNQVYYLGIALSLAGLIRLSAQFVVLSPVGAQLVVLSPVGLIRLSA